MIHFPLIRKVTYSQNHLDGLLFEKVHLKSFSTVSGINTFLSCSENTFKFFFISYLQATDKDVCEHEQPITSVAHKFYK